MFESVNEMWRLGQHPKEELISAMVDGKLGVADTRLVAEHLRACETCRAVMADFERIKQSMRSMVVPALPDQKFWDDTFRKMRVSDTGEPAMDIARVRRQWQGAVAAVACIAVAIVVPISVHTAHESNVMRPPVAEDTIDDSDVSTFVQAHTESAAYQPLGDPDRQQMIAAEADGMTSDDQATEAVGNADVSP